MKWFRHESRAHLDAKLQKLMMKYGFEGYGLYWFCLENICATVEPRLTFELEIDSEILSHVGKMDSRKVEEVMLYIISLDLFENNDSVISCLKLARYLGEKSTRNQSLIDIIKSAKVPDSPGLPPTVPDSPPTVRICPPEIRGDKRREDKHRGRFTPPGEGEVAEYIAAKGYHFSAEEFIGYYESQGWRKANGQKITSWKGCCSTFEQNWKKRNPGKTQGEPAI